MTEPLHRKFFPLLVTGLVAFSSSPVAAETIISDAGDFATVTTARDAYRAQLGGGDTTSGAGLFGGIRREINWDAAGDAVSDPNLMPAAQFLARGATFGTDGEGLIMSAKAVNPTNTAPLFASFAAEFGNRFATFTAERLFAAKGSNHIDLTFSLAGTTTAGVTRGFGAVFVDVDEDFTTSIEYFTRSGQSLGKFFVPATEGDKTFSFLGVDFGTAIVHRVEIVLGNAPMTAFGEPQGQDVVVADDFLFGEPVAAAPGCTADATTLCLVDGRFQLSAEFATAAGGARKKARTIRLSDDSGNLYFFNAGNIEILAKVLDGCAINNRYWVYSAAATDVEFEVKVVDLVGNDVKKYFKPFGPPAPAVTDTNAFASCP